MNSRYTHTGIDKQLVKNKRIQTKPVDFSFKIFNIDGTKSEEVTRIVQLKIDINEYKECIEVAVTNLNGTNMFSGHNLLTKHNPEVN